MTSLSKTHKPEGIAQLDAFAGTAAHPPVDRGVGAGEARKERALSAQEASHAEELKEARTVLRRIFKERLETWGSENAFVDADDIATRTLETGPWMGALFREKGWRATGWRKSQRTSNNGRSIRTWRWEGSDGAANQP